MRILGIDPGIARCGWGVIEVKSSDFKVQSYGCIETDSKVDIPKRLLTIYQELINLIDTYKPDAVIVEELFFNTNSKTAFIVGQARGVILLSAAQRGLESFTYTPLQVKLAVTGYGRAEKSQIGQMVKMILHLESIPKPDDVADALAVALTHGLSYKMINKGK